MRGTFVLEFFLFGVRVLSVLWDVGWDSVSTQAD